MSRVSELTKALKKHDSCLYAQEAKEGRIDIYRAPTLPGMSPPHFICSLTDTWGPKGRPIEWGNEVVLQRLKAHDLWRDDTFVENYLKERDKETEGKNRDIRNNLEGFLEDMHWKFKRATSDINTSLMDKKKGGLYGHR